MNHNMNSTSPNEGAPSPVSDDSSIQPQSPVSPHQDSFGENGGNASGKTLGKRKPSRRASTAERRATHNAVERARRETLNGRFLDLAALLPNLSQLRRPSKSAIVNSSIAHVHAARRHRLLASRELRLLKLESDALRRELNEWRGRSGIPRIEEPVRGEGFSVVLSGEPEIIHIPGGPGLQEEGDEDGFGEDIDDDYRPMSSSSMQNDEDVRVAAMLKSQAQTPFVPSINTNVHPMMRPPSLHPRAHPAMDPSAGGPMIASPTAMSFENPILGRSFDSIPYNAGDAYPGALGPVQEKWGGYPGNVNDQAYLKSLAQSRRARSGSQSSGSASPPSAFYEQVAWNNASGNGWNGNPMMNSGNVNGMNMDMGMHPSGMGMVGGGSTMGNVGVAFAMM